MRNKLAKGVLSGVLLMGLVVGGASVAGADEPTPDQAPATASKDAATNGGAKVTTEPALSERTLPSGVKIIEQRAGVAGAQPGDIVLVHYTGTLENGKKFDSSLDRGQPFRFTLGSGQVIKGWDVGIQGMLVGEKRKLIIPADMAYGERETGPIPANSTLVFEVELIGLVRQTPPAH